jgi:hypothetical protein
MILVRQAKSNGMKKLLLISMFIAAGYTMKAQTPVPESDTAETSKTQIDPEVKQQPADINYIDETTRIAADELPPVVLDSLKKLEPQAWEKSVVYKQKKEDSYKVEIRDGGEERSYRFDKEGRRLKTLDQPRDRKKRD